MGTPRHQTTANWPCTRKLKPRDLEEKNFYNKQLKITQKKLVLHLILGNDDAGPAHATSRQALEPRFLVSYIIATQPFSGTMHA